MLNPDPKKRFTIDQIKKTLWYCGPVVEGKQLGMEFEQRKILVTKQLDAIKLERKKSSGNTHPNVMVGIRPHGKPSDHLKSSQNHEYHLRKFYLREKYNKPSGQWFLPLPVSEVYAVIKKIATNRLQNLKIKDRHYKIKGGYVGRGGRCLMTILVTDLEASLCCVEVNKNLGDLDFFYDIVQNVFEKDLEQLIPSYADIIKNQDCTTSEMSGMKEVNGVEKTHGNGDAKLPEK